MSKQSTKIAKLLVEAGEIEKKARALNDEASKLRTEALELAKIDTELKDGTIVNLKGGKSVQLSVTPNGVSATPVTVVTEA